MRQQRIELIIVLLIEGIFKRTFLA